MDAIVLPDPVPPISSFNPRARDGRDIQDNEALAIDGVSIHAPVMDAIIGVMGYE